MRNFSRDAVGKCCSRSEPSSINASTRTGHAVREREIGRGLFLVIMSLRAYLDLKKKQFKPLTGGQRVGGNKVLASMGRTKTSGGRPT